MITMLGLDRFIGAVTERYRMPPAHSQLLRTVCNDQNRASWTEAAYLSFFPFIWFIMDRELGYSSSSSTQLAFFNPPYRLRHDSPKAYEHYALKKVDPELDSEVGKNALAIFFFFPFTNMTLSSHQSFFAIGDSSHLI
jgi:hypothetical protein